MAWRGRRAAARCEGRLGYRYVAALGMPEAAIDSAAKAATRRPYPNPAALDYERIRDLLASAWSGETAATRAVT
jgi:hypothetical protein